MRHPVHELAFRCHDSGLSMSNDPYSDDVELVTAAQAGDTDAFGRLCDRWSDPVFDVVVRIVRDREIAADVAQAVFVVAWQNLRELSEPASFGSWLLRAARYQALNRLEQDRRSVARGAEKTVIATNRSRSRTDADAEQADPPDLVWAVSAALGERDTSILSLHLRHGIPREDLAEELGTGPDATNTPMFRLRTALGDTVQAWALWHGGQPACDRLRSVLTTSGLSTFGRDAVRVITSHAKGCGACASARAEMVSPEELFAAVGIVTAPVGLKSDVVAAVEAQRVRPDATGAAGPTNGPGGISGAVATGSGANAPAGAGPDDSRAASAEGGLHRVVGAYAKLPRTASWLVAAALLLLVPALGAIVWITDVGDVNLARLTGTPETSVTTNPPDAPPSEPSAPTEDTGTVTPSSTTTPGGPDAGTAGSTTSQPTSDNPTPTSSTTTSTPSSTSSTSSSSTSTSSTSTSTTSTSTSTTQPQQLEIVSFTATREPQPDAGCSTAAERIVLSWETKGAESVSFEGSTRPPGGTPEVSGTAVVCSLG